MTKKIPKKIKIQVKERAHYCCEYCFSQEKYAPDVFSVEHIFPQGKDGETILSNLALACQFCNNKKYIFTTGIDPISGEKVDLFNPRTDLWDSHFQWNHNFTLILGLTSIGRATIKRMELNREKLLNLRAVLVLVGEHPPRF